jgi:7,8-dihydropterin-6-yl-methyl-4-(beta-D-ribofuranosyl)aminobenzene 5'-phosphate synthase
LDILGTVNKQIEIYLPTDYSANQTNEIARLLNNPYIQRMKDFQILDRLTPRLATTGTQKGKGKVGEQALLIKSKTDKVLLVVGCMHPGLEPFMMAGKNFGKIEILMGGVHGFKNLDYLQSTMLNTLYLGHCTQHLTKFQNLDAIKSHDIHLALKIDLDDF